MKDYYHDISIKGKKSSIIIVLLIIIIILITTVMFTFGCMQACGEFAQIEVLSTGDVMNMNVELGQLL